MSKNIDRQIVSALGLNGRRSFASLAQELGINVATLTKKVDRMLDEEIIAIKAVPNPFKMGYEASAFVTLDVNLTKVQQVCDQLVEKPNISLVVTAFGRFDVLLIADFCSWEMLQGFVKSELSQIEGIERVNTFLVTEVKKRYESIYAGDSRTGERYVMDDLDRRLIEELGKNGRALYADLARKVGASLATVSRRVDNLLSQDIIKITAIPNPSKMGYPASAFIGLQAGPEKTENICNELAAFPEVHLVMTTMNGFDILVGVNFPNPEALYNFITGKIAHMAGVSNVETYIFAEFKKRIYGFSKKFCQ